MTSSDHRRWWAVAAMVPAVLVVGIDATVLSLALPTLAVSLDASTAQLQWFVSVYLLVFAAALLPAGMLGDRYGRKRLLLAALVVLGLSSLACAYATTPEQFMAARVALGVGAAMIVPAALGALPALFSPAERPKAVAAIMAASIVGQPIGPLLGGWLLTSFWWGAVFIINVPVVLAALLAAALLVPESRSHERPRFDPLGIALSSAGLAAVTYGVILSGQEGWGDPTALAAIAAGAGLLSVFVLWERRTAHPLVDIRLFRSPHFSWGTAFATLVSFAMMGLLFAAPLYFQDVVGLDAFGNGLRQLPMIGGLLAGAVVATRLAQRAGARLVVGAGFTFIAAGLVLGSTTSLAAGEVFAMLWLALCGLGMGLAIPTTTDAALGALSPEHGGVGSGLIQALRMVGGALGAAVMGSILNSAYRASLDVPPLPGPTLETVREGVSAGVAVAGAIGSGDLLTAVRLAFLDGMQASLLAAALAAGASALLALRFMPRRAKTGAASLHAARGGGAGRVESGHGTVATD
jgi:EmrB/QacA subfamily drug resistance transporter